MAIFVIGISKYGNFLFLCFLINTCICNQAEGKVCYRTCHYAAKCIKLECVEKYPHLLHTVWYCSFPIVKSWNWLGVSKHKEGSTSHYSNAKSWAACRPQHNTSSLKFGAMTQLACQQCCFSIPNFKFWVAHYKQVSLTATYCMGGWNAGVRCPGLSHSPVPPVPSHRCPGYSFRLFGVLYELQQS